MLGQALAEDLPGRDVQGSKQRRGAVALVVVRHGAGLAPHHPQRRLGAVQGMNLAILVHAQDNGLSGGLRYNSTTSRSLSSNFGSLDNLNVSTRCGFNPRASQIRCTVAGLTPT